MEIIKSKKEYDVIVVGSGAGGGMATKILSDAGVNVALVESGPYFDPANPDQQTRIVLSIYLRNQCWVLLHQLDILHTILCGLLLHSEHF